MSRWRASSVGRCSTGARTSSAHGREHRRPRVSTTPASCCRSGEQDRSRWNRDLIEQGRALLDESARGDVVTTYHLEAAIAAVHAKATTAADTDWNAIVTLYDTLLSIAPSAVIALNRAIAVAQRDGPDAGIAAILAIAEPAQLEAYPFLAAALGELERRRGDEAAAAAHFARAVQLARNGAERRFLEQRRRGG